VTVYILLPALVFETLVTTSVDVGTVASIAGAMVVFTFLMGVIAWATDRSRGQEGTVVYGAAMVAAIPNVGNFGVPVASFAFGVVGRPPCCSSSSRTCCCTRLGSTVTPMVLSFEFADDPDEGVSTGDYVGTVIFLTIFGSLPIVTGLILLAQSGVVA